MQNLPGRGRERGVLLLGYLPLDLDFGEMLKVAGGRPHPPEPSHVTPCTAPRSRGGGAPAATSSSVLSRARKPLRCSLSPSEPPTASATTATRSRRAWLTLLRHHGTGRRGGFPAIQLITYNTSEAPSVCTNVRVRVCVRVPI